jgi:hypothetical protein
MIVEFKLINYYEFDYGSEWTRADSIDSCELNKV